jgi:hypothetical protein
VARALRVSYHQTRQCNFAICDVVIDPFGDQIILIGSIATDPNKRALFKKLAVGDRDHLKVFASADAAETWFEQNDPEGVAFEYEVLE